MAMLERRQIKPRIANNSHWHEVAKFSGSAAVQKLWKTRREIMPVPSNTIMGVLLLMLLILADINARPQHIHPAATFDPNKAACTTETANLCQQCAKKTKSDVVYPWCCTNHEGARNWCENYLYFGLK